MFKDALVELGGDFCVVYCMDWARVCPEDAISFPPKEQTVALVKELRAK